MRILGALILILAGLPLGYAAPSKVPLKLPSQKLELVSFARIQSPDGERFDLSGVAVREQGSVFLVNDKTAKVFQVSGRIEGTLTPDVAVDFKKLLPGLPDVPDLEAIRILADGTFIVSAEYLSRVIHWDPVRKKAEFVMEKAEPALKDLKFNMIFGLESLCTDGDRVLLVKEREPVNYLWAEYPSGKEIRRGELPFEAKLGDVSDCLIEDGIIYLVNRDAWRILLLREDPKTHELKAFEQWDFAWINADPRFRYWLRDQVSGIVHEEWGTGEALALTQDTVLLGLDNNGLVLRSDEKEARPTLLVFKRPHMQQGRNR